MSAKTVTELVTTADYADTRGRAAAVEWGYRTENEIVAFKSGAEWMYERMCESFVLTPRITLAEVQALLDAVPSQESTP